jgi:MFS family permease
MWPAGAALWAYWAPPAERSRLIAFSNGGSQIGNVITLPLGGFLCIYGFDGGWPSIFYILGGAGVIWSIIWFFCATDSPRNHKLIKESERDYILEETKMKNVDNKSKNTNTLNLNLVRSIFTSRACIGLMIGHTASNWGAYLFLTKYEFCYLLHLILFNPQ